MISLSSFRRHRKPLGWLMTWLTAWSLSGQNGYAATGTWNLNANGNWNSAGSWQGGVIPNGAGDIALFNAIDITADRTVNMTGGPWTVGQLTLNEILGNNRYIFSNAGGLVFDNAGSDSLLQMYGGGNHDIQGTVTLNSSLLAQINANTMTISGQITGAGSLTKNGSGTLVISNNTNNFGGGIILNGGTLQANGAAAAVTDVLGGNSITSLRNGSLALRSNGTGNNGTVNFGSTLMNIQVDGSGGWGAGTTPGGVNISVDRVSANTGNILQLGGLTLGPSALNVTSGNSYSLRFVNTTVLNSPWSTLAGAGLKRFGGSVTGVGALNLGVNAGTTLLENAVNTYAGGTNVMNGAALQLAAGAAVPATGAVLVNQGGRFSVNSLSQIPAGNGIRFNSQNNGLAVLGLDVATTSISAPLTLNNGAFDTAVQLNTGGTAYTGTIDLSQINGGSGVWIGAAQNSTIGAGASLVANAAGKYLLGANNAAATTLTLSGADLLTGSADVVIGHGNQRVLTTNFGTGTVVISANQNYTGSTLVNSGSTLNIGVASSATTSALGNGPLVIQGGAVSVGANANNSDQLDNTSIRIFQGGVLDLDNRAVTVANADRRLTTAADIDLSSSTLRLRGTSTNNTATSQTVDQVRVFGSSNIDLVPTATGTENRDTVLAINNLERVQGGTLRLTSVGTFGAAASGSVNDAQIYATAINGVAPVVVNGMGPAWIVNQTSNSHVTYGANGFTNVTYGSSNLASGGTGAELVNYSSNATITTLNVHAIRVNDVTLTGGTITLGSNAGVNEAGVIFIPNGGDRTHTSNWFFGTAGNKEAILYTTNGGTARSTILTGKINATGLTKFGGDTLQLNGDNRTTATMPGLTGTINVNQGTLFTNSNFGLGGSANPATNPYTYSYPTINLSSGTLRMDGSVVYGNDVTVNASGAFLQNNNVAAAIQNLTINESVPGSNEPLLFSTSVPGGSNPNYVMGNLTLNKSAIMNITGNFNAGGGLVIEGSLAGSAGFEKWGNSQLLIAGDSSGYSAPINVYVGVLASLNASSTAKPFGTGNITVNPGGSIRYMHPNNTAAGQVTLISDLGGVAALGLGYIGDLPNVNWSLLNGGPADGVIGIDVTGYSKTIDLSASANGTLFLGSTGNGSYSASALTVGAGNVYRLGGGTGNLQINSAVLGGTSSVQIGVMSNGDQAASVQLQNLTGIIQLNRSQSYSGTTTIHQGSQLMVNYLNSNLLGDGGTLIFNGGSLNAGANSGFRTLTRTIEIANPIQLTGALNIGDNFTSQVNGISSGFILSGPIAMNPGQAGYGATFGINHMSFRGRITGQISEGAFRTDFVKNGVGILQLSETAGNNWTGNTYINDGYLEYTSDNIIPAGSTNHVFTSGGGIAVTLNSVTTNRDFYMGGGHGYFAVGSGHTLTQSPLSHFTGTGAFIKQGEGIMYLNGTNGQEYTIVTGGVLVVSSHANLGDPEGGADRIQLGGFEGIGGTLRIDGTFATNRGVVVVNTEGPTNTLGGGIDVTAGNVFTVNGVFSSGTSNDFFVKSGAGTMLTTASNTFRNIAMQNGTWQFNNAIPWSNAASVTNTIDLNGGTIYQVNTGANLAVAAGSGGFIDINFGAGGEYRQESGGTFSSQITLRNLTRMANGTLVLSTGGTTTLGATGNNTARVIPTSILGVAAASANVNGIISPKIVTADAAGTANFATYIDATNGIRPYAGAIVSGLNGALSTDIADLTAPQTLTGNESVYAVRTAADISGGTLYVTSLTATNGGGILINGSNLISSGLVFTPGIGVTGGDANGAEGLVYVKSGESATISGSVTADKFTKFGTGALTLSGNSAILGNLSVQNGTLKLGSGATNSQQTDLVVNNSGKVDLNDQTVMVDTLSSSTGNLQGGGLIGNNGLGNARLMIAGTGSGTFQGTIVDSLNGGSGTVSLVKAGSGTLNLPEYQPNSPDSNFNTFSGGTYLYQGTLQVRNPQAVGTGAVNLLGGRLDLLNNGVINVFSSTDIRGVPEGLIMLGGSNVGGGLGSTVNVLGPVQVNVDRSVSWGHDNIWQVGALNMSNNTLSVSGANGYRLRVAGTTMLQGNYANFSTLTDGPSGTLEFNGKITGPGALNKLTGTTLRRISINSSNNDYTGGTYVLAGGVQVNVNSGTPLGSGPVRVLPDGQLYVAGNASLGGASLRTLSRATAMGAVGLVEDFNPTFLNSSNFSSTYGTTLLLGLNQWNTALNMSTIGDGRAYLGAGTGNLEASYLAATLGAGLNDPLIPAATGGVYRVTGAQTTLSFAGVDNVLSDNGGNPTFLQVGNPLSTYQNTTVGNGGATVTFRNSNNFTGGTQIARGATVTLDVGLSMAGTGQTPLGTGAVEIFGAITNGNPSSYTNLVNHNIGGYFNPVTGANSNVFVLRPGGRIDINATVGVAPGGQGKWADATGQDLNGGSLRFLGDEGDNSQETIGSITVRKNGTLHIGRAAGGTAQLNIGGLTRSASQGTLNVTSSANGTLGIPDVSGSLNVLQYDRLLVSGGVSTAGTTIGGAGAPSGIVAPWMVYASGNTFMSYSPTTGFQPLIPNTATPAYGQVAYSNALTGTPSISGGTAVADVTGTATLGNNWDVYALRSNQNISPTATLKTITIRSGGLILNGGTINQASPNTQDMALNFGASGTAEALIYTGGNAVVNAAINANGLTKFGASQLQLQGNSPDLTGDIYVNAGTLLAVNLMPTTGNSVAGVLNSRPMYLNSGSLRLIGRLGNATDTVSNVLGSGGAGNIMTDFRASVTVRGDQTLLDNNGAGVPTRIDGLIFDGSGDEVVARGLNSPIALQISGIDVRGTTSLGAHAVLRATAGGTGNTILSGKVTGGILQKFDNGMLMFANGTNDFTQLIVNGSTQQTSSSIAGSMTSTGTPFGVGAITVNPGAGIRVVTPGNIAGQTLTLKTDGIGLASFGLAYDGALPAFGTGAGQLNFQSTGDYCGAITLDIGMYTQAIDQAAWASGGKEMWLGASHSIGVTSAGYFNATMLPGTDGVYRFGGGGSQGTLVLGVNAFENVLSGTGGMQVGVLPSIYNASASQMAINGNLGNLILTTRNVGLTGDVWVNGLNAGATGHGSLEVRTSLALGSTTLKLNGGNLILSTGVALNNQMDVVGDSFSMSNGGDWLLRGNINLAPSGVAGTRTLNLNGNTANIGAIDGIISGVDSSLIRTGGQNVVLRGLNTYTGTTTLSAGITWLATDVLSNQPGALGNSDTPIMLSGGSIALAGQVTVGRDLMLTASATTFGRTVGDSHVAGNVSIPSTFTWTVNQVTTSAGNFRGGRLYLDGAITGAGAVQLGDTSTTDNRTGAIVLGADANGFSASNYTSGTTIQGARIVIAANTFYRGTAASPTILSGPFGTGSISMGSSTAFGVSDAGTTFEAGGGARTVVNTLAAWSRDADATIRLAGLNDLTFTSNWDINSAASVRNRTFDIQSSSGALILKGNLTNSGAQGSQIQKNGVGNLVLEGVNTTANLSTASANYGTFAFINAGVLTATLDTQLGSTSVPGGGTGNHTVTGPADIRLAGGIFRAADSFSTARNFILVSGSAIDVVDTKTLTLQTPTNAASGAQALRKLGNGTLSLQVDNAMSSLNIGGVFTTGSGTFNMGQGGGTVVTNRTSGSVFGDAVNIRGGTLHLLGGGTAQSVTMSGSFATGGGANLRIDHGTTTSTLTVGGTFGREASSQGTLVLIPNTIADLGTNAKFIITGTDPTNANGMLTTPYVVVRGQANGDANFVRYVNDTAGFSLHNATTQPDLLTSGATNLADITGGAATAAAGDISILALRTDSNIAADGSGSRLLIGNGGLILNGASAPVIGTDILFGTSATALGEGLVYVRGGQTGDATFSGNITGAGLTKYGPGTLLLSGTSNAFDATSTLLRIITVNEGILKFAGQSSVPANAIFQPNDTGRIDLNGLNLQLAAIGLAGTTIPNSGGQATGIITNNGASVATLTLGTSKPGESYIFAGSLQDGVSPLKLVVNTLGTQILTTNSTYTGGTTINAGRVVSAVQGLGTMSEGTLRVDEYQALGVGTITLAGGILNIRNARTFNEVVRNVDVTRFGPGEGYDIVISALNNFGQPNLTSQITYDSTAAWQLIRSLTVNAPALTFAGGSNNGLMVDGTTTLAGDTRFNMIRPAILGGQLQAAGKTVTVYSTANTNILYLMNSDTGSGANQVGAWNLLGGVVEARTQTGGSNPLGQNADVNLSGGTLNLRDDGDNTSAGQRITSFASNKLKLGNSASVSSGDFTSSLNSTVDARTTSGGNNKTVVMNDLEFKGALGSPYLTATGSNTYSYVFNNVTMVKNGYLSLGLNATINGSVSGNGTLLKQGSGSLYINSSTSTATGGTFVREGTLFFGAYEGNGVVTLSDTAKLGSGDIRVNPGAAIQFNGLGNLNGSQRVEIRTGDLDTFAILRLASDNLPSDYNVRFSGAGSYVPLAGASDLFMNPHNGSAVLAINATYTQTLDMARMGDGTVWLGSTQNGVGLNGSYNAATLGVGRDNIYRLGAGGQTLYFGSDGANSNALTDTARASSLMVGTPAVWRNFGAVGNGSGTVVLHTAQNFTGSTTVNRGSALEIRESMGTSGYENWGTLILSRNASLAGGPAVTMQKGGELRLDNNIGLLPDSQTQGRYGDTTALTLDNGILRLRGSSVKDVTETVGTITAKGGSTIAIERQSAARAIVLEADIVRGPNAVIALTHNTDILGADERFYLKSGIGSIGGLTNGMVAPWMISATNMQFLTYTEFGFQLRGFNKANGLNVASSILATDTLYVNSNQSIQAGQNINAYAMRIDDNNTISPSTAATPELLIIGSGGLLQNTNASRINTHTVFGSVASPVDAVMYINSAISFGNAGTPVTVNPQIVADNIIKAGPGTLRFEQNQIGGAAANGGALAGWGGFQGDIFLQQGRIELRTIDNSTTSTVAGNKAGGNDIYMNGIDTRVAFYTDGADALTTFNNNLVLGADNPFARVLLNRQTGTVQDVDVAINNLTFQGAPGLQGQSLIVDDEDGNLFDFWVNGVITLSSLADRSYNIIRNDTDVYFKGQVTEAGAGGAAVFVKTGDGFMRWENVSSLNNFTGGVNLTRGTLEVRGAVANPANNENLNGGGLGTGPVTFYGGILNLRIDGDNSTTIRTYNWGNMLDVRGNTTINMDRLTANGGSNKQLSFSGLQIGSQTLTIQGGNGFDLRVDGTTTLTGNPIFANNTELILNGPVNGRGSHIVQNGGTVWFNTTGGTFDQGYYVNSGDLRFGTPAGNSNTATLGAGNPNIQINPAGRIVWAHAANVNSAGGQRVTALSNGSSLARIRLEANLGTFTPAYLYSTITSNSNGTLYLNGAYSAALDMAQIGNGKFFLGGSNTYSAPTLGVGAGGIYRLGGELNTSVTMTFSTSVFTGANQILVGSQAANGQGQFLFSAVNNLTGQTVVNRGSLLRLSAALSGTNGGLGAEGNAVNVFGELRFESNATAKNSTGTGVQYSMVLHPGSILRLQDANATGAAADRWLDTAPVNLNGSMLLIQSANAAITASEGVGDLNFERGSRVFLATQSTAQLTLAPASLTRTDPTGTMVFINSAAGRLGNAPGSNSERIVVGGATPTNVTGTNMLPGYYIAGSDNTFVTYGANGFTRAGFDTTISSGLIDPTTTGVTATSIVDVGTAALTLNNVNPTVFALRTNQDINNGPGQYNTITFAGTGSDVGGLILHGANRTINPNLVFGDSGNADAYIYVESTRTLTTLGDITAGKIIKFGNGQWNLSKDISDAARGAGSGYSNGWVVNEGSINATTFGSLGNAVSTNTVVLNGNTGANSTGNEAILFLRANNGSPLNETYTSGKIIVVDRGRIDWDAGANDRTSTIAAIDIESTNLTGMREADARVTFNTASRARSYLHTGTITLNGNAIVEINGVTGGSTGIITPNLAGSGNLTKWGSGYLYVRNASTGYTGDINIEQGAIAVAHPDALGSGSLTVSRYGVLDLQVAGFTKSATYEAGSVERWSVDSARTGALNLGPATLQVNADQTQTVAVTLSDGGGIEGYLRTDDLVDASFGGVFRTLGANVTFNTSGKIYLGQRYTEGTNGLDMGLQARIYDPYDNAARGVQLEIKGAIGGTGSIVKTGSDTVTISGANIYSGSTSIENGTLRLGAHQATPSSTELSTRAYGVLDLNGYNTSVGKLSSPSATNGGNGGFITNAATTENTLTVGTGSTGDAAYGGVIQNNVALTKVGSNVQSLTNQNTYIGKTTVNGGTLALGNNGTVNASIDDSRWLHVGTGATFSVTGRTLNAANGGYTFDGVISGGGTIATGNGGLTVGSNVGAYGMAGVLKPGDTLTPGSIATAGSQIGALTVNGNLTLAGPTAPASEVERLVLGLGGATGSATGTFFNYATPEDWVAAIPTDWSNLVTSSTAPTLHDYINVTGTGMLTLNPGGTITVENTGYQFQSGDVFNLLDWVSIVTNGFNTGAAIRNGTETNTDLDLPTLNNGLLWNTSLFASHGVLVVVPEPGRVMLVLLGLLAVGLRRRRW